MNYEQNNTKAKTISFVLLSTLVHLGLAASVIHYSQNNTYGAGTGTAEMEFVGDSNEDTFAITIDEQNHSEAVEINPIEQQPTETVVTAPTEEIASAATEPTPIIAPVTQTAEVKKSEPVKPAIQAKAKAEKPTTTFPNKASAEVAEPNAEVVETVDNSDVVVPQPAELANIDAEPVVEEIQEQQLSSDELQAIAESEKNTEQAAETVVREEVVAPAVAEPLKDVTPTEVQPVTAEEMNVALVPAPEIKDEQLANELEPIPSGNPNEMAANLNGNPSSVNQVAGSGSEQIRELSDLRQKPGNRRPQYDTDDRLKGRVGEVSFLALINKEGQPTDFKLVKSSGHRSLDLKTLKAIRSWKFYPGQAGWVEIPFKWDLQGGAKEMPATLRRKFSQN